MLPLSRMTPCNLHWNPFPSLHHPIGRVLHSCITHNEAAQKHSSLPFHEHIVGWAPPCFRAPSESWQCFANAQNKDSEDELTTVPVDRPMEEGEDRLGEAETVLASWSKDQVGALEVAPATGPLAQVEEEKDAYVGRALRVGKGALIAELLQIFNNLLERPYGGGESVAKAGGVVIERIVSDVQELRGQKGVNEQILFELLRVIRFLEMDMELVRAAQKEETLLKRLETAQVHCKQAFTIASSF